jgi:putative phosphoesterase
MKLAVLSDLHANIDALLAVWAEIGRLGGCDAVLVLGDLVDYGPEPLEVIEWVRNHCRAVIRGNHDNAAATGADCRCSAAYARLSRTTRAYFQERMPSSAVEYLRALPLMLSLVADDRKVVMVHATPADPLFAYLRPDAPAEDWQAAVSSLKPGVRFLLVGHTHLPVIRQVGEMTIVNPGSVGQPKDGDPRAAFGIIENGEARLCRAAYDVDRAVRRIRQLDLVPEDAEPLCRILTTGGAISG